MGAVRFESRILCKEVKKEIRVEEGRERKREIRVDEGRERNREVIKKRRMAKEVCTCANASSWFPNTKMGFSDP